MENKESRSIGRWISVIHRQFQIYINNQLKPYDLNSSEYPYLVNLATNEGVSQKYLSDILCVDEALTTRVIKSLEQKEYVIREKSLEDKRSYNIRLTEKGKKIQPIIMNKLKYWTEILSEDMSEEQVDFVIHTLNTMANKVIVFNKSEKNKKNQLK